MRCRLGVRLGGGLVRGDTRGRPDVRGVPAGGGRRQVQGRVLLEHGQLKFPQLRARLDGQFLDQQRAPGAVGLERVGLTTAAVESDHQLPAEPLAHRMLRNELLELGAYDGVPAVREFGVDPVLDDLQAESLEPPHLQPGERLELQVGQRPAAPQRLRFPQQRRGLGRIAVRERLPPGRYLLLERLQVQLAVLDPQQVTGRPDQQPRLAFAVAVAVAVAERLA